MPDRPADRRRDGTAEGRAACAKLSACCGGVDTASACGVSAKKDPARRPGPFSTRLRPDEGRSAFAALLSALTGLLVLLAGLLTAALLLPGLLVLLARLLVLLAGLLLATLLVLVRILLVLAHVTFFLPGMPTQRDNARWEGSFRPAGT